MKKNLASTALAFIVAAVFLVSCSIGAASNKDEYLKEYSTFIKDIEENKDNLTEEQWKEKDKQFEKYSNEMYNQFEGELGVLEQVKIGKNAIKYAKIRGLSALDNLSENGELNDAINELKDLANSGEIEDAINEFKNVWNDDMKADFEKAFGELKGIWDDDLKDKLEGSLDEVKSALESGELELEIDGKVKELNEILEDEELKDKVKDIIGELKEVLEEAEKELDQK